MTGIRRIAASILAALGATSGFAADMPVKSPVMGVYDWTGFYLGVNAGVHLVSFHRCVAPFCAIRPVRAGTNIYCGARIDGDTKQCPNRDTRAPVRETAG